PALRYPNRVGSQFIRIPPALPHTEVPDVFARTGPDSEGTTPWGSSKPGMLLYVLRLVCHRTAACGRYCVRVSPTAARAESVFSRAIWTVGDRKSTRMNSSHRTISYDVL